MEFGERGKKRPAENPPPSAPVDPLRARTGLADHKVVLGEAAKEFKTESARKYLTQA